jgi:hypothetical protein
MEQLNKTELVEIINVFKHSNGEIFELKFCGVPKTAPKEFRFQWFLIYDHCRYNLKFVGFEGNVRILICKKLNAKIELDISNLLLIIKKNSQTSPDIHKLTK